MEMSSVEPGSEPSSDVPPVGKGRPPAAGKFRKGQSGNPKGRPKGSKRLAPYHTVLGQMVTVQQNGKVRRMTAAEAFILHITRRGLQGDSAAARTALAAIEEARARRRMPGDDRITTIIWRSVKPGSVNTAIEPLKIGKVLDPYRETAHTLLEPWIVEAALSRLGERRLSADEQYVVWNVTRTPERVSWPDWWASRAEVQALLCSG